jgi:hypothetical protein
MFLATALSMTARETVTASALTPAVAVPVAVASAVAVAPAGIPWCWYCGRYEGFSVNPETLEWEAVVYAYCEEWPSMFGVFGGGVSCDEPPNNWNFDNEWEGDVCALTSGGALNPCNCSWEPPFPWPGDPLTIDNCEPNTPAQAVAADGFVVRTRTINVADAHPAEDETTCNGIITGVAVSTAAAHQRQRMSKLII